MLLAAASFTYYDKRRPACYYSAFIFILINTRVFVKAFLRQQPNLIKHPTEMFIKSNSLKLSAFLFILSALFLSGCGSIVKTKDKRPTLLKIENATQAELVSEINRYAKVNSMRAKMDLKFEDNSYAELGLAEKYRTAPGEIVVQRPANIFLKVQVPVVNSDIVQMTSDGEKFRVAILQDNSGGKYKKFVLGTNNADYSVLQEQVQKMDLGGKDLTQNVNAFSNLRPQHFTDAMLIRPVDTANNIYVESTILQDEVNFDVLKKSPLGRVLRGYYLLDEIAKNDDGTARVLRRFWFDRVGTVRLARQQIFDAKGEIESDIVYGNTGNLSDTGEYNNLPLQIEVTRPKEKYKMKLTYQSPETVTIGKTFPQTAFVLKNTWNLQEVDLDKKLLEAASRNATGENQNTAAQK